MTVKRNELVLENKWDGLGDTLTAEWDAWDSKRGNGVTLRVEAQNGLDYAEFDLSQKQATHLAKFLLGT